MITENDLTVALRYGMLFIRGHEEEKRLYNYYIKIRNITKELVETARKGECDAHYKLREIKRKELKIF
jgi:hypothetical protein